MQTRKKTQAQRLRKLTLENMEQRNLLTSVPFAEAVALGPALEDRSVEIRGTSLTDLDSDGDLDILTLSKSSTDPAYLSWYLNAGDGTFGEVQREAQDTRSRSSPSHFLLADIDGDGDKDVVRSTSAYEVTENQFSDGGSFGATPFRSFRPTSQVLDVGDFNGDGMDDFVTSQGWIENLGDAIPDYPFAERNLEGLAGTQGKPLVVDIEGDGDLDIVRQFRGQLRIQRNVGGMDVFAEVEVVDLGTDHFDFGDLFPVDFDDDGDSDLLLVSLRYGTLTRLENTEGLFETRDVQQFIDGSTRYPVEAFMQFDATGDGQLDLIFWNGGDEYSRITDFEDFRLTDVAIPAFGNPTSLSNIAAATTGDIDGDGDLDWLGTKMEGDIRWFDSTGDDATENTVAESVLPYIEDLTSIDFDNDSDVDLLYLRDTNVYWIENLDNQAFAKEQVVFEAPQYPQNLHVIDITGDGLPEVSYSVTDNEWHTTNHWRRNLGNGELGSPTALPDGFSFSFMDLDNDGRQDVLSRTVQGNIVRLNSGDGGFDTEVPVPDGELTAIDIDQDGDMDLVVSRQKGVSWFANLGNTTFSEGTEVVAGSVYRSIVTDADSDGDADLIVIRSPSSLDDDPTHQVFENRNGQFVRASEFNDDRPSTFQTVRMVDLDKDGDLDLVRGGSTTQAFIENKGNLQFEKPQSLRFNAGSTNYSSFVASDLDEDGLADLAAVLFDQIVWHRNILQEFGPVYTHVNVDRIFEAIRNGTEDDEHDWNDDNRVDQADVDFLLQDVFHTRRGDATLDGNVDFEDFLRLAANFGEQDAGWHDGDFDGDGIAGFADFLLLSAAFGSGE